jgi:hypothetical protein
MNLNKIIKQGGATLNMKTLKGTNHKDGYMVGVAGITRRLDKIKSRKVRSAIKNDIKEMAKDWAAHSKDLYIGLWANNGWLYIDLSKKVDDFKEAVALGIDHKQKALWDNANKIEITLDLYK